MSITTLAEGRFLDANDSFLRLTGYSREEVIGRTSSELGLWVNAEERARMVRHLRAHSFLPETTVQFRTKSGEIRHALMTKTLLDVDGRRCVLSVLHDLTERERLEEQVRDYSEQLQILSRRLLEVQEQERRAIGRELHDEIGQLLTGLKMTLETSLRSLRDPLGTEAAQQYLHRGIILANELIARIRDLSVNLRPAVLDDLGLVPALQWFCSNYSTQTQVRVTFHVPRSISRLPPAVATTAYRIVQEALTNVARHAQVNAATVMLSVDKHEVVVEIHDQGVGFDYKAVLARKAGGGLVGMQERAALVGGRLTIESAPGAGTRVTAHLPLGCHRTRGRARDRVRRG
jgi:PAS domain S-box-containing protein